MSVRSRSRTVDGDIGFKTEKSGVCRSWSARKIAARKEELDGWAPPHGDTWRRNAQSRCCAKQLTVAAHASLTYHHFVGKLEALMKELGGMDIAEMKPFAGFSEDGKN